MPPDLSLLAINLTQRCNLACQHCYLDATSLKDKDDSELSTQEVCNLLDNIAKMDHGSLIVLTGGEPLIRRDIEKIVAYGASKQLVMVLGTNGALLTKQRVKTLQQAGLMGAGISLDSLSPEFHDQFRGQRGSWQQTMNGIENCRQAGLSFQLHFSITDDNADELDGMIVFSREVEARVLNIFFLVCTGRGESFSNISPLRYERTLLDIIKAQEANPDLIIRARCAPHYKRVAYQKSPQSKLNQLSGREGDGCIAGIHYARITHNGNVTACPYVDDSAGNIRESKFSQIWSQAEDFKRLREPKLEGRCGQCEFQKLCGGCRARPLLEGNGLMGGDNFCTYSSNGEAVIQPLQQLDKTIRWSEEAQTRLQRIPRFIRKMVKKRAETYVAEQGELEVTTEHLKELSARRFGGKMPKRPF